VGEEERPGVGRRGRLGVSASAMVVF
jgi:hypothetical protein